MPESMTEVTVPATHFSKIEPVGRLVDGVGHLATDAGPVPTRPRWRESSAPHVLGPAVDLPGLLLEIYIHRVSGISGVGVNVRVVSRKHRRRCPSPIGNATAVPCAVPCVLLPVDLVLGGVVVRCPLVLGVVRLVGRLVGPDPGAEPVGAVGVAGVETVTAAGRHAGGDVHVAAADLHRQHWVRRPRSAGVGPVLVAPPRPGLRGENGIPGRGRDARALGGVGAVEVVQVGGHVSAPVTR